MSIFDKIFGIKKESEPIRLCDSRSYIPEFDKYDEFGQIVSIFDFVLNPDFTIANKAAQTVQRLFEIVQVYKNKQLYDIFRYLRINKSDIKKFNRFEKEIEITLLCIASMNGNGYSREEALNKLIEIRTQKTIPFILFRLADWVGSIRQKAEKAIQLFLVEENTIYFIRNHKLINWLLHVERNDLSELYNQIVTSVASKRIDQDQLKTLNEGDRFFYFKSFVKTGLPDNDLINQMVTDKYYLIRMLLIKYLDNAEDVKTVLAKLLSDKSKKVRQEAVNLLASQNINEYQTILETMVFDSSTIVRVEARRLLNKIYDCDFKNLYQESLSKKQFIIGSILGLSEVSDQYVIPLLQEYLESDRAKIRTASLFGIYNLDTDLGTEKAYQILENENPVSTKRAAETILLKQGIDFERLRMLYDLTDVTGKKIILRLFNRYSGWSVAGDFLKTLTEDNAQLQSMARVFLESWNRYTIRLATNQRQEEKDYVLGWYKKVKGLGIEVSDNIPFVFREK